MRAALLAALIAMGPGAALGDAAWPTAPSDIGLSPWAAVAASPAFDPEDAYLFADVAVPASSRPDPAAEAAAYLVDRRRLSDEAAVERQETRGRVAAAFSDFIAYGSNGGAYASLALARAGTTMRLAAAQTAPFVATVALAGR